jgi:2-dehydro-3-deoxyphosphogalactonate aldolase
MVVTTLKSSVPAIEKVVRGCGEAYALPFHPNVVEKLIADVCQRYVLGSDPFRIEWLW